MVCRISALLFLVVVTVQATEIKGKVTNVIGGEALGQVQVAVLDTKLETNTAEDGTFALQGLTPGKYVLRLNAIGYRLLTVPFSVSAAENGKEFSITMVPDNFRRTDTVEVRGDIFQGADPTSVAEENLTSTEVKQASTVFANDPFRAVQALPGVSPSGNNELFAEFSVMGAPFVNVAIYIDDVLVPHPFHSMQNVQNGASLSLLTSETVEEMKLLPAAYPEKYGDDIGAALDIRTRDGSRTAPLFRASVGMADSDFLGEGRLGPAKHGSWLASVRRSYLGYLVRNRLKDLSDISFTDGDLKLVYDLTSHHLLSFYGLVGHTNVEESGVTNIGSVKRGDSNAVFLRTGWRWSVGPSLIVDSHTAYIGQPYSERNIAGQLLSHDSYDEFVGGSNVAWSWKQNAVFEGGWTLRRLRDNYVSSSYAPVVNSYVADQSIPRGDAYVQQAIGLLGNRLHFSGGLRWDGRARLDVRPWSPQVSAAFQAARSTQLQFGFGRYIQYQFPDYQSQMLACTLYAETYQQSQHYTAGIEQRLGESTRIRVQAFDRQSGDHQAFRSASGCPLQGQAANLSGTRNYSRGVQVVFQRRSANRLSGWLGYTLVYAKQSLPIMGLSQSTADFSPYFSNSEDQRHSVNAFASYRLRPTINLSGKLLYGSGFPIFTGLELFSNGAVQPLPVVRLGPYLRLDVRTDKCWAFHRWKLTLYGEVLNLTDHNNRILKDFTTNGQQIISATQRALPVTPTAGLVFEF